VDAAQLQDSQRIGRVGGARGSAACSRVGLQLRGVQVQGHVLRQQLPRTQVGRPSASAPPTAARGCTAALPLLLLLGAMLSAVACSATLLLLLLLLLLARSAGQQRQQLLWLKDDACTAEARILKADHDSGQHRPTLLQASVLVPHPVAARAGATAARAPAGRSVCPVRTAPHACCCATCPAADAAAAGGAPSIAGACQHGMPRCRQRLLLLLLCWPAAGGTASCSSSAVFLASCCHITSSPTSISSAALQLASAAHCLLQCWKILGAEQRLSHLLCCCSCRLATQALPL
jgi:hypothetical protein